MKIGKLKKAGISLLSLFMVVGLFTSNVKTIEAVESDDNGITINMFDYDAKEDDWIKQYQPKNYWNQGINDGHTLKFTNGDPLGIYTKENTGIEEFQTSQNGDYNVWVGNDRNTDHHPRSGMVEKTLDNGYPVLKENTLNYKYYTYRDKFYPYKQHKVTYNYTTNYTREPLDYLFNTTPIAGAKTVTTNVTGLLEKDGYHYSYDSAVKSAELNGNTIITSNWDSSVNGDEKGFWPYGYSDKHFGMTMSASFTMTSDGKVDVNGKKENMVFEFSGDDDVWVFIDGALILDIGGIHGNTNGKINFMNGKVEVQNNNTYTDCGTIAELMKDAGIDSSYYSNNTLSKNVVHTINFFYLERGEGQSNCKLDFYLPIIKTKDIKISKDVEGVNEAFKDGYTFNFTAAFSGLYADELNNIVCEKYDANGVKSNLILRKENEKYSFTLKDGEYIILKDIVEESNITVTESDDSNQFSTTINGINRKNYESNVSNIDEIKIINTLNDNFKGNLKITKMFEGEPTKDSFEVNVKIDDQNYNGEYSINNIPETTNNGNINIQNEQTIVIEDIPINKSYLVVENLTKEQNLKYLSPQYTDNEGTIKNTGNNVTITNQLFTGGEIQIVKSILTEIEDIDFTDGDPIFTFKITNVETGENWIQYIKYYIDSKGQLQYKPLNVINGLKAGSYTIEELSSLRYSFVSGSYYYNDSENNSETFQNDPIVTINISRTNHKATVTFSNQLKSNKYDSDNGILVNKFVKQNDTIKCIPDALENE